MTDLPKLAPSDAIPPALAYRLSNVAAMLPAHGQPLDGIAAERLSQLVDDGEAWLGADPALAELGMWMLGAGQDVDLRRRGCAWLARFPTVASMKRLAEVAHDPATPAPVRDQAIWSLGYRQ